MNESEIIDLARQAIILTIEISLPALMVGLIVGVAVALVQALTQIQEQTLVFVPKLIAIFLTLFVALPAMGMALGNFMTQIADKIVGIH